MYFEFFFAHKGNTTAVWAVKDSTFCWWEARSAKAHNETKLIFKSRMNFHEYLHWPIQEWKSTQNTQWMNNFYEQDFDLTAPIPKFRSEKLKNTKDRIQQIEIMGTNNIFFVIRQILQCELYQKSATEFQSHLVCLVRNLQEFRYEEFLEQAARRLCLNIQIRLHKCFFSILKFYQTIWAESEHLFNIFGAPLKSRLQKT